MIENNGILVGNSKEGKTTPIISKASSAVRQAHGPEQSRRAALPSIAPPCGVLPYTPQSSLLDALHLAWILHESLATTTDMVVLPAVLGCRPLRRTIQVRLGANTLRLPGGTPILVVSRQQFMQYPGWHLADDQEYCRSR